jgi:hypothetical protein
MGKACGVRVTSRREIHTEVWSENLKIKSLTVQMCEDNVEIYSKEIGWVGMDWFHLIRERDVAACNKHGFYKTREMCGL